MDKWFGIVRWCREDVESAILERGLEANPDFVDTVVNNCMRDHHFTDRMIEAGWETIGWHIDEALQRERMNAFVQAQNT